MKSLLVVDTLSAPNLALRDDLLLLKPFECFVLQEINSSSSNPYLSQVFHSRTPRSRFFFCFCSLVFSPKPLNSRMPKVPLLFLFSFLKSLHSPTFLNTQDTTPHLHSYLSPCSNSLYSLHYVPHYWSKMCKAPGSGGGPNIPLPTQTVLNTVCSLEMKRRAPLRRGAREGLTPPHLQVLKVGL